MIMEMLEKLASYRKAETQTTHERFRQMLEELADGKEIDLGELDSLIVELGVDPSRIPAEVQAAVDRQQLHATLKAGDGAKKKVEKLRNKLETACQAKERTLIDLNRAITDARVELQQCESNISESHRAKEKLIRTCSDPLLTGRMEELNEQSKSAWAQRSQFLDGNKLTSREAAKAAISGHRGALERLNAEFRNGVGITAEQREKYQELLAIKTRELQSQEASSARFLNKLDEFDSAFRDIEAEREIIREQMVRI